MTTKRKKQLIISLTIITSFTIIYTSLHCYYNYKIESLTEQINKFKTKRLSESKLPDENLKIINDLKKLILKNKKDFDKLKDAINLYGEPSKEKIIDSKQALDKLGKFFKTKDSKTIFNLSDKILYNKDYAYEIVNPKTLECDTGAVPSYYYSYKILYQIHKNDKDLNKELEEYKKFIMKVTETGSLSSMFGHCYLNNLTKRVIELSMYNNLPLEQVNVFLEFVRSKDFNKIISINYPEFFFIDEKVNILSDEKQGLSSNYILSFIGVFYANIVLKPYHHFYNNFSATNVEKVFDEENTLLFFIPIPKILAIKCSLLMKRDYAQYLELTLQRKKILDVMIDGKITKDIINTYPSNKFYFSSLLYLGSWREYDEGEYFDHPLFDYRKSIANLEIEAYRSKNGKYPESLSNVKGITLSPLTGDNFKNYNFETGEIEEDYNFEEENDNSINLLSSLYILAKIIVAIVYVAIAYVIFKRGKTLYTKLKDKIQKQ